MDFISHLIYLFADVKRGAENCKIYEKSMICGSATFLKDDVSFTGFISVYRVQDLTIRIDKDGIYLNGFISTNQAIENHLLELIKFLQELEEVEK